MRRLLILFCMVAWSAGCFYSPDEDKIGATNTDTTTVDQESVQAGTGSETCVPGTDAIEGMGDTCQGTDDCSTAAPKCQKDPSDTSVPGQCTVAGCLAECCPDGYSCCTCELADIQTCIPASLVDKLEGFCGATACD